MRPFTYSIKDRLLIIIKIIAAKIDSIAASHAPINDHIRGLLEATTTVFAISAFAILQDGVGLRRQPVETIEAIIVLFCCNVDDRWKHLGTVVLVVDLSQLCELLVVH